MESVTEEGVLIREQGIVPTGWASVLLLEPRLDTLREREREREREERGRWRGGGERERGERERGEREEEKGRGGGGVNYIRPSIMCARLSLLNFILKVF